MDDYEVESTYDDDLETRIAQLEERLEGATGGGSSGNDGGILAYGFGTTLAMILSWSRNASILYCIGHGLLSWGYVVYFAFTR